MTAAQAPATDPSLDTRAPREDQQQMMGSGDWGDAGNRKQQQELAGAKSAGARQAGRAAPPAARHQQRQQQQQRPRPRQQAPPPPSPDSLLARLAAAAGLGSFVGALYVATTLLLASLTLLLLSAFANPAGWLLLALWLLLAVSPLGPGAAFRWGFGAPRETHAALASPAPSLGRSFVRYVTAAAEWYFPVRVVVEGEDEAGEEDENEAASEGGGGGGGGGGDGSSSAAAAAAAAHQRHRRRHAVTLRPEGAYMIGLEPHSVLPLAMPACFSTDSALLPRALRGQRVHCLASSVCFSVPLIRHLWWSLGIRPVSRRVVHRLLSGGDDGVGAAAAGGRQEGAASPADSAAPDDDGGGGEGGGGGGDEKASAGGALRQRRPTAEAAAAAAAERRPLAAAAADAAPSDRRSVVLIPGGVQECLYMEQPSTGVETAFLSNRRGFVRAALRSGADGLVPAFAFGQSHGLSWARPGPPFFSEAFVARVSRSLGALPLALWGRWGTPAPHRKPMVVVVGRPIPLPRPDEWAAAASGSGEPPAAMVQAHLDAYIRAMKELVERHKVDAGFPETTLRVL
jgi:hypothetical protein